MYLESHLYCIQDKLPINFCDEVIKFALDLSQSTGQTGYQGKKAMKVRNSFIVWLDEPWISQTVFPFVEIANKEAKWDFNLTGAESLQFTKYVGSLNQHYDWHTDSGKKHANRKLSFVIQLSDPETYVGGQFLINTENSKNKKDIGFSETWSKKGTMLFFPSFIKHTVTPVVKGTRYSLVGWCTGPRFK